MAESITTRLSRLAFNLFPAYFGTGARVTYIASDWLEVRVELPLNLRTRNYVGTIFGGSMYGAVDPIYMLMLIKQLGPDYVVWDKAASIRFKRPGREKLQATFRLDPSEIEAIRRDLQTSKSIERVFQVELCDQRGTVHSVVDKTLHIRRK